MVDICWGCQSNIEEVEDYHEQHGHNICHEYRYDLVPSSGLCEDCIDAILEDICN